MPSNDDLVSRPCADIPEFLQFTQQEYPADHFLVPRQRKRDVQRGTGALLGYSIT